MRHFRSIGDSQMVYNQSFISRIVPWVIVIGILIGSLILLLIGSLKLVIYGFLLIGIPLILPATISIFWPVFFKYRTSSSLCDYNLKFLNHIHFIILFLIIYIFSITLVFQEQNRTLLYFLLVTLLGGIILFEIILFRIGLYIILLQEVILLINLTLSFTLKHTSPIFSTDTFFHIHCIELLSEYNHLFNGMGQYQNWPLFHIMHTMGLQLTNLDIANSFFIINSLYFSIVVFFVFLITNKITRDLKVSLFAVLIYIFMRPVDDESMNLITRSSAYIFCIMLLYLLLIKKTNIVLTALSVFLIVPLILTHQTTLAYFSLILLIILISEKLTKQYEYINKRYLLLFLIAMISYWFYLCGPVFQNWVQTLLLARESVYVASSLALVDEKSLGEMIFLVWDYLFLIFVSMVGAITNLGRKPVTIMTSFSLASIIMLPFVHPSISNLFLAFLGYRFPIMVSLFVSFIAASGIIFFLNLPSKGNHYIKFIFIILILSFFLTSSTLTGRSTDFDGLQNFLGKTSRGYLLDSELRSFDFYLIHKNGDNGVSDYVSSRYLNCYMNNFRDSLVGLNYDLNIPNTYLIFREGEYRSGGMLSFSKEQPGLGFGNYITERIEFDRNPNPNKSWLKGLKIYDNSAVSTYLKEL